MARPQRNNVDYFPFLCEEGEKMYYLEETYGNDGFATFVKLLRELAKVDYHYLNLSKPSSMMFLSAKCKVSKEVLEALITDLVMLEKFGKVLWNENKVIWCQDFIDSIQDAYTKRANKCIDYNSLLLLLTSLGVRKPSKNTLKPSLLPLEGGVNPQSIVKDSKEKDIYRKFNHLSLSIDEFNKLEEKYNKEDIDSVLDSIENYKLNKNYTSLYFTANKWLKKDHKQKPQEGEYVFDMYTEPTDPKERYLWMEEKKKQMLKSF